MPRTNEDGRNLQVHVQYLLNRADVPISEMCRAIGIARNTYTLRSREDDFPNAEEVRRTAEYFGLNPLALLLDFGLVSYRHIEELDDLGKAPGNVQTKPRRRVTLRSLPLRIDVPAI